MTTKLAYDDIPRLIAFLRDMNQPPCDAAANEIERLQEALKDCSTRYYNLLDQLSAGATM